MTLAKLAQNGSTIEDVTQSKWEVQAVRLVLVWRAASLHHAGLPVRSILQLEKAILLHVAQIINRLKHNERALRKIAGTRKVMCRSNRDEIPDCADLPLFH